MGIMFEVGGDRFEQRRVDALQADVLAHHVESGRNEPSADAALYALFPPCVGPLPLREGDDAEPGSRERWYLPPSESALLRPFAAEGERVQGSPEISDMMDFSVQILLFLKRFRIAAFRHGSDALTAPRDAWGFVYAPKRGFWLLPNAAFTAHEPDANIAFAFDPADAEAVGSDSARNAVFSEMAEAQDAAFEQNETSVPFNDRIDLPVVAEALRVLFRTMSGFQDDILWQDVHAAFETPDRRYGILHKDDLNELLKKYGLPRNDALTRALASAPLCKSCGCRVWTLNAEACEGCGALPVALPGGWRWLHEEALFHPMMGTFPAISATVRPVIERYDTVEKINDAFASAASPYRAVDRIVLSPPEKAGRECKPRLAMLLPIAGRSHGVSMPKLKQEVAAVLLDKKFPEQAPQPASEHSAVDMVPAPKGATIATPPTNTAETHANAIPDTLPPAEGRNISSEELGLLPEFERGKTTSLRNGCKKTRIVLDDQEYDLIEAERGGPLESLFRAALDVPISSIFPPLERLGAEGDQIQAVVRATPSELIPFNNYVLNLQESVAQDTLSEWLLSNMTTVLESLDRLHQLGFAYGLLHNDSLWVDADSGSIGLCWPEGPHPLNETAESTQTILGLTCPEHGDPTSLAEPSWDLFGVGAILVWALVGVFPPPSLSDPAAPSVSFQAFPREIPFGWIGWISRLLAKRPRMRFAGVREAIDAIHAFYDKSAAPTGFLGAAGRHVGREKSKSNPINQDRCFLRGSDVSREDWSTIGFEGYDAEDSFVTETMSISGWTLLGVSDGVSTAEAGEFASTSIVKTFHSYAFEDRMSESPDEPLETLLLDAAEQSNEQMGRDIIQAAQADGKQTFLRRTNTPSATLAALLLTTERACALSIGDSRTYLLRSGILEPLTVDGDHLSSELRKGVPYKDAVRDEDAGVLLQWVGKFQESTEESGLLLPDRPESVTQDGGASTRAFIPRAGDILCCCSDGLSDFVDYQLVDLGKTLRDLPPTEACRSLINEANERGGGDNISVVIVYCVGENAIGSAGDAEP